jgi:hypothetical protein
MSLNLYFARIPTKISAEEDDSERGHLNVRFLEAQLGLEERSASRMGGSSRSKEYVPIAQSLKKLAVPS